MLVQGEGHTGKRRTGTENSQKGPKGMSSKEKKEEWGGGMRAKKVLW